MARTTSVSLGDHFSTFISAKVDQGRYGSATDVIRAGLRLLEEHEDKIQALQMALADGEASGDSVTVDRDDFLARMHAQHVKNL
ncbi:type II toxin-antitoxin system ParD family antitoxin [Asticcacaulis sp. EMRT-3]|uniref:type II toxin-antitoxin system ParD family antitoxin n=1 Tax=Asticcacaulis sp. EMRT-3 TaxID=3040349 RepID=UPI0024AFE710|nr:type II toxin-antitoxin system ParD family antitoxin [Asticcacaulis sp. EMRT-3]MDI7776504.1 type II toxin-antitoxin system ParD family antitoxin [Asticcacaulis sp. EMRT-3]